MPKVHWTPDADAHLRAHWLKRSARLIGEDLRISPTAVVNRSKALGLPRASDDPELLGEIRRKAQLASTASRLRCPPPEPPPPPPVVASPDAPTSGEAEIRTATMALGDAIRAAFVRRGWRPFAYRH